MRRRPRSDTLRGLEKYPENVANAMKTRRLLGPADVRPAAPDTIAKVAAMAALRPLLQAEPIRVRRADWSGCNPDAQVMKSLSVCLRGPAVGSNAAALRVIFFTGPTWAPGCQTTPPGLFVEITIGYH
jgi:hypothetical protein